MRKLISFLAILLLGVLSSACVNTFAVHELNQMAADFIEKGDVNSAIARLESSVDLDNNIYESRYNLAVAYLKINECEKALKNIEAAQKLSPKEPAVYYTLGVAYNCLADKMTENDDNDDENDEKEPIAPKIPDDIQKYNNYLEQANTAYEKYIELAPQSDDIEEVRMQIGNNNNKIYTDDKKLEYNEEIED